VVILLPESSDKSAEALPDGSHEPFRLRPDHVKGIVMGQAAVDLPDSPEKAPAPLNSADDLLSRLAGAEIDRMLAASEQVATQEPATSDDQPEANDATQPAKDVYAAEVDQLFKQLDPSATEPAATADAPAPVDALAPADAAAGATSSAEASEAAPVEVPAQSGTEPAPPEAATAVPDPEPVPESPAALDPPPLGPPIPVPIVAPPPEPEPLSVADAIESAVKQVAQQRGSLLVRMLEWVNAPLAWCPDVARDLLGKLAILTLMNALGVLLYVALFRR
jgi:hypothetical protein